MKNVATSVISLGLISLGFLAFSGCEAEKGPAQKAGENVDKGIQNVKDKLDPAGPVEKAGRAVDRAAK
jgi:hypothetical protein